MPAQPVVVAAIEHLGPRAGRIEHKHRLLPHVEYVTRVMMIIHQADTHANHLPHVVRGELAVLVGCEGLFVLAQMVSGRGEIAKRVDRKDGQIGVESQHFGRRHDEGSLVAGRRLFKGIAQKVDPRGEVGLSLDAPFDAPWPTSTKQAEFG